MKAPGCLSIERCASTARGACSTSAANQSAGSPLLPARARRLSIMPSNAWASCRRHNRPDQYPADRSPHAPGVDRLSPHRTLWAINPVVGTVVSLCVSCRGRNRRQIGFILLFYIALALITLFVADCLFNQGNQPQVSQQQSSVHP